MILDKIKDRIGNFDGTIGISYIDLGTGECCNAGNSDVFPASGLVKLLILIEAFKRMEEGIINRSDKYVLTKEDYPQTEEKSYGALDFLHVGTELTLEDLYKLNVTVSDNMAFNILLKLFTKEAVNSTMETYGCHKTRIHRALLDDEETAKGIKNYVSVQEMANLFYRMEKGQIVSGRASREMLDILLHHQKTSILPYYFSESMEIAHQSGYDEREIMDMGIVYAEHPFILCMASSTDNIRNAESIMLDITLMCYQNSMGVNRKRKEVT